ncbi:uncharacterized protein LOC133795368 [Humulus lupulus]|uniref:uncharacterized protein LOC133795368 n=1 Tax=Humulus lupulus TaxID=3486 RepID=UPI002B40FB16|nr:uncharacterized protein LOC133795368 [Humulus lupulus]
MVIDDDDMVKFFMELHKKHSDETVYPLLDSMGGYLIQEPHWNGVAHDLAISIINNEEQIVAADDNDDDPFLYGDREIKNIKTGHVFQDKQSMITSMSLWSIRSNYQHRVKRASNRDYVLVCLDEECKWYFRSSKLRQTGLYKVRKFDRQHTCSLNKLVANHPQAKSKVVSECIKRRLLDPKTKYNPRDIMNTMIDEYSVSISYQKAWRAKEKARETILGCPQNSYRFLPGFLFNLQKSTKTDLVVDENNRFKYLLFAIGASIKGWAHCTPIIVVDGTFLKASYGGTLLTASAQNANRKIHPLAFGIVDSENDTSWEWFMNKVKEAYGERNGQCIISDRHESIKKVIDNVYDGTTHGVCTYHLLKNIKKNFKKGGDDLKTAFNGACRAYNKNEFQKYMLDLDGIDDRIRNYLTNEVGLEKCTRLYSNNNRYSTMTSNIAESINLAIKEVRELPVTPLVEALRSLVQEWYLKNKNIAAFTFTRLPTTPDLMIRKRRDDCAQYKVESSNQFVFTVYDEETPYIVNMEKKTCTCKRFEYDERPCSHAMAVIIKKNLNCYDYVSYYYTKEAYMATYEDSVMPLGDQHSWEIPVELTQHEVLPPLTKRPARRPKQTRYRAFSEYKVQNLCGRCGGKGHNRRTCKNEPVIKTSNKGNKV